MEKKKALFLIVLVFAGLYYIGRLAVLSAAPEFENEVSDLESDVVHYSFLVIGVLGLLLLPGLALHKPWSFWGTLALSLYTVAFDLWALVFIQPSAAAGIIPSAGIAGYLLVARRDFLHGRPSPNDTISVR